jgi:hypothetical protein
MATKQQKHPGTQFVQQQELDETLKSYPTIIGVSNFVTNVVPKILLDMLESDAFKAKVLEVVTAHATERANRPEGLILLPESSL